MTAVELIQSMHEIVQEVEKKQQAYKDESKSYIGGYTILAMMIKQWWKEGNE